MLRVADIDAVKSGEILAARMTSPDWILAFDVAVAIVTEQGGALCHAAVVARERGIPAVVGVGQDLRNFRDGELVVVDGTHGTITKVG